MSVSSHEIDKSKILYNKYVQYWNQGSIDSSRTYLDSILNSTQSLSDYHKAIVFSGKGTISRVMGEFDSSVIYFNKSINLLKRKEEYRSYHVSSLIGLGNTYSTFGELERALLYYENAKRELDLIEYKGSNDQELEALLFENASMTYLKKSDYNASLHNLLKSISIRNDFYLGDASPSFLNLAKIYERIGEYDSAFHYYDRAISFWENRYDRTYYKLAPAFLRYAKLLKTTNLQDEADYYFIKSIQNYKENYGNSSPYVANALTEYCIFLCETGFFSEANNHIENALSILTPKSQVSIDQVKINTLQKSTHDINYIFSLIAKAKLYYEWSKNDKCDSKINILETAIASCNEAIRVSQRLHSSYLSEGSRYNLVDKYKDLYLVAVNISLELYKLTDQKEHLHAAYKYIALSKGSELKFRRNFRSTLAKSKLPKALVRKIEETISLVNAYTQMLDELQNVEHVSDSKQDYISKNLLVANEELDSLLIMARSQSSAFDQELSDFKNFDLSAMQKRLGAKNAILEYYFDKNVRDGKRRLICFLITNKEVYHFDLDVDTAVVQKIELLKVDHLSNDQTNKGSVLQSETNAFISTLYELHSLLVYPLNKKIRGKNLIIIPDEELNYIPFEILLIDKPTGQMPNFSGLNYLIKEHSISYGYSSDLTRTKRKSGARSTTFNTVIPAYRTEAANGLFELSSAHDEGKVISKYFKIGKVYDGDISKDDFLSSLRLGNSVHLAMHALSDSTEDQTAYLLISNNNKEKLKCYDYEIETCRIQAPLIVLNACKTGSGIVHSGDGVASLSRSFLIAGASSVLHTLWEVEDEVAKMLMESFYYYLSRGHKKNDALQKAKLDYLKSMPPAFAHPKYWAPFQISGDVSAIKNKISVIEIIYLILTLLIIYLIFHLIRKRSLAAMR